MEKWKEVGNGREIYVLCTHILRIIHKRRRRQRRRYEITTKPNLFYVMYIGYETDLTILAAATKVFGGGQLCFFGMRRTALFLW